MNGSPCVDHEVIEQIVKGMVVLVVLVAMVREARAQCDAYATVGGKEEGKKK